MNYLYFLLATLPVIAGLKLYDLWRSDYERSTGNQRDHFEKLWHAAGFWTMWLTVIINALLWIPVKVILLNITWVTALGWIVMDLAWNINHNVYWLYPGNGKGNMLEIWTYASAQKLGLNYKWVKLSIKLVLLAAGITIALCF